MKSPQEHPDDLSPLVALFILPGVDPAILETTAATAHCLVLTTFALGSLPTNLHQTVREITDAGKPVFILSDNPGEKHGVVRMVDRLQIETQASGAIFLEKVNVNNEQEVYVAIQKAVAQGLRGVALGEEIRKKFAYGPGEERPTSILDRPEEGQKYLSEKFDQYKNL